MDLHDTKVIEKFGIFRRLIEDKFTQLIPSVLICGGGYPSLATRALTCHLKTTLGYSLYHSSTMHCLFHAPSRGPARHKRQNSSAYVMSSHFHPPRLPILGVADFNPEGYQILQVYSRGSIRSAHEGGRFSTNPSAKLPYPRNLFQNLTLSPTPPHCSRFQPAF